MTCINVKFLIFIIFINLCDGFKYKTFHFKQKVDHFSYSNNDFFFQRYLMNKEFYSPENGTIFFYTGNEGYIEVFANNTGFMWENAKLFNAAIIFAEHRYYGTSLPYGNLSYTNNTYLGFLTSEQALADFAELISYLKTHLIGARKAPIIAFGGSYGGMLAAWIRIKYPHLITGAVASSAPVLQFKGLTPCHVFSEIVTQDFMNAGHLCAENIKKSWKIIRRISDEKGGMELLVKNFHLCLNSTSFYVTDLINWLSETWNFLALTNYPYSTNFLVPLPPYPIREACKYLNSSIPSQDIIKKIYKAVSVFHNYTGDKECFDVKNSGASSLGLDGWYYQACTEMVQPMCQNGISDMFEPVKWNFTHYTETCLAKYGLKPDLYKVIMMYGGKNIKASSNIIFTNGLLDPWHGGGVLKSISDTVIAILIEDAAHHLDLRSSNPADPLSVIVARQKILKWIAQWIKDARK